MGEGLVPCIESQFTCLGKGVNIHLTNQWTGNFQQFFFYADRVNSLVSVARLFGSH